MVWKHSCICRPTRIKTALFGGLMCRCLSQRLFELELLRYMEYSSHSEKLFEHEMLPTKSSCNWVNISQQLEHSGRLLFMGHSLQGLFVM
jgi:hypothetical protein